MANRRNFYYRQLVTESELDGAFDELEVADRAMMSDHELYGVVEGLVVSQHAGTPDLTVDVAAGIAYSKQGKRLQVTAIQNVDVSVDSGSVTTDVAAPGNSKIISIFLEFDEVLSDPRIDGNSATVYFQRDESFSIVVVQGSEAVSPSPPSLNSNRILLADITRTFGDSQILNAVISPDPLDLTDATGRREDLLHVDDTPISLREVTLRGGVEALLTAINGHFDNSADRHDATDIDAAAQSSGGESVTLGTVASQVLELLTSLDGKVPKSTALLTMPLGPVGTTRRQLLLETANADDAVELRVYATSRDLTPASMNVYHGIEVSVNAEWDGSSLWSADTATTYPSQVWRFSTEHMAILRKVTNTGTWDDDGWDNLDGSQRGGQFNLLYNDGGFGQHLMLHDPKIEMSNVTASSAGSNLPQSFTPFANAIYSKNIVKAWGFFELDNTGAIIAIDGFNIQTPSNPGAGTDINVTFRVALSSANYAIVATDGIPSGLIVDRMEVPHTQATTGFSLQLHDVATSASFGRDVEHTVMFVVLGTQS